MRNKHSLSRLNELKRRVQAFDNSAQPSGTLFSHLASAIVSQQLSLKAAATIYGRFSNLFSDTLPDAESAIQIPIKKLREAGLSQAKALSILDLAQKTLDKTIPTDDQAKLLTDPELIERLIKVRGIGKWTVEMVLIFRYRRLDVWPVDDLAVQKGFRLIFPELKFKNAKELDILGDNWKGSRTEIAWYCWRAIEEQNLQSYQGVPLSWEGLKVMLWLKNGRPVRLDFKRTDKKPTPLWPGVVSVTHYRAAHWQKFLSTILKNGSAEFEWTLEGTEFQRRVWLEIAKIPWGETKSYLDIAKALNNPKGVRAIAQACGANPLPLLIPCHRVVASDGLGGFGGGIPMKKRLLKAEGVVFL